MAYRHLTGPTVLYLVYSPRGDAYYFTTDLVSEAADGSGWESATVLARADLDGSTFTQVAVPWCGADVARVHIEKLCTTLEKTVGFLNNQNMQLAQELQSSRATVDLQHEQLQQIQAVWM